MYFDCDSNSIISMPFSDEFRDSKKMQDGPTDGRTNGLDRPSYRYAWTHLKRGKRKSLKKFKKLGIYIVRPLNSGFH